ncbi:nucleolus and neural progenitor protein isoform X2 [Ascaphus truei]
MELVSVKILGACKLILRLMDGCCKAFHLFLQHLNLEEFIVLNVVLLGLLSRLWVMYRGILKKLISLYGAQFSLQQEVSGFQNMPYIKDFSFPAKIEDFLGPVLADIVKKKLPQISSKKGAPQLLNKMFSSNGLINKDIKVKRAKIVDLLETRKNVVDLGRPIQIPRFDRGNFGTFNVKKLCQPLKASAPQVCRSKRKSTVSTRQTIPSCHRLKSKCAAQLVPKVQRAESFRELSEQLQDAVKWCKHRKLISEVFFLRKKYLKIKRLKYIEALGNSLKRKLECLKKSICSGLQQGTQKAHHRKPHAKIQSFLQTGWGHKVTRSRENRSKNYQNRQIIYSGLSKPKAEGIDLKKSAISLHEDLGDQEGFSAVINIVTPWEERSPEMLVSSNFSAIMAANISTDADDIDDIFSSIGL